MDQEEDIKRELKYFKNLPVWPNFTIYNKNIDGLIPSAQLESWDKFHELVNTYSSKSTVDEYIFRGQHRYDWALQPTLDRLSTGAIEEEVAKKQLRNFRLSVRGRVPDSSFVNTDEDDIWAMGQHHGLATPLLDWTSSPYVALFFAFMDEDSELWIDEDGEPTNHSRAVYILNKSFIEDLILETENNPVEIGYPKIVEPSTDDHGRIVNQAGLFTMAPYNETIESSLFKALSDSEVNIDDPKELSTYICKVHIPNSSEIRRNYLQQLRKMNIHYGSLFPDVIGASGFCNEIISEFLEYRNKPKPASIEEANLAPRKPDVSKNFAISESDHVLKTLVHALLVDDSVKGQISEIDLKSIAKTVLSFIETSAGVDWYIRDSQISRLKNIIRRQLKKIQFPDDFISAAAESIISEAAEMSRDQEQKKGDGQ